MLRLFFFGSWVSSFFLIFFSGLSADAQSLLARGNVILINGKSEKIEWSKWKKDNVTHFGIIDPGIANVLGIETLSNDLLEVQPAQWFSSTMQFPVLFDNPYRYLDITELLQNSSTDCQISGDNLILKVPPAQITHVEHQDKSIELSLDSKIFWQIKQNYQQAIITLTGIPTSEVLNTLNKSLDNSATFQTQGTSSQITINLPPGYSVRASGLTHPYRLLIELRPDNIQSKTIKWQPGISWHQDYITLADGSIFPVVYLEIDPKVSLTILKSIFAKPNGMVGISSVSKMNRSQGAIAGINGGYFDRKIQQPLGAIKRDGSWLSNPILNRGVIAWNDNGDFSLGRLNWQENLSNQQGIKISVVALNSGFYKAGVTRYTQDWGSIYTPITDNEKVFLVENKIIKQEIFLDIDKLPIQIHENNYLLVLRDQDNPSLKLGTQLEVLDQFFPDIFHDYSNLLGAGPLLVQDGKIILDPKIENFQPAFQKEHASRSAIATTFNGTFLLIVTHKRLQGQGANLQEFAELMQKLGAQNALNLDGGSSSSLYLGGQSIDNPSKEPAKVNNGLSIFLK